jgi:hypothetical protein
MTVLRLARSKVLLGLLILAIALAGAALWQFQRAKQVRQELFLAFTPVALANCTLQRFGDANDGGYLLCGNLLKQAQAAYSYGINATDEWGCQVSRQLGIGVHQYDCFNTIEPPCAGGDMHFNAACVGPEPATIDGRVFDTMLRQVAKNGDAGKRLVVKMDVEGSEWASLRDAPDSLLNDVNQLVVEFHEVEDPRFIETVRRLTRLFYIAHVHQNNFGLAARLPATAGRGPVLGGRPVQALAQARGQGDNPRPGTVNGLTARLGIDNLGLPCLCQETTCLRGRSSS